MDGNELKKRKQLKLPASFHTSVRPCMRLCACRVFELMAECVSDNLRHKYTFVPLPRRKLADTLMKTQSTSTLHLPFSPSKKKKKERKDNNNDNIKIGGGGGGRNSARLFSTVDVSDVVKCRGQYRSVHEPTSHPSCDRGEDRSGHHVHLQSTQDGSPFPLARLGPCRVAPDYHSHTAALPYSHTG